MLADFNVVSYVSTVGLIATGSIPAAASSSAPAEVGRRAESISIVTLLALANFQMCPKNPKPVMSVDPRTSNSHIADAASAPDVNMFSTEPVTTSMTTGPRNFGTSGISKDLFPQKILHCPFNVSGFELAHTPSGSIGAFGVLN